MDSKLFEGPKKYLQGKKFQLFIFEPWLVVYITEYFSKHIFSCVKLVEYWGDNPIFYRNDFELRDFYCFRSIIIYYCNDLLISFEEGVAKGFLKIQTQTHELRIQKQKLFRYTTRACTSVVDPGGQK